MGEQSHIPNFLRLEATARLITVQQENNTETIFCFNYRKTKLTTNSADSNLIVATSTALETVVLLFPKFFYIAICFKLLQSWAL